MATVKKDLALEPIFDGSGSTNASAGFERVVSTGTQTTGTPKVTYDRYVFGTTTDQFVGGVFRVPDDYVSGGVIGFEWGSDVTTNEVKWVAGMEPFDVSSTDTDAAVFNALDTTTAPTVPGTVGHVKNTEITLTTTGITAGEMVAVFVGRDQDHADDDAAGDCWILCDSIYFEYANA